MHTSEVLNRAADLMESRGWTRLTGWWPNADGPLCLEGAISAAMGESIHSYGGFTGGPNLCPAGQAVREYLELGPHSITTALFNWNDELRWADGVLTPQRSAAEVIATLRAAALIEAAKEQPDPVHEDADERAEVGAK